MRILISGGGTGGHFYPAFAITKKLIKENFQPVFIIKKNDISKNRLIENDIPFVEIDIISFPRTLNIIKHIIFFIKFIKSLSVILRVINDFEPEFSFSTGSYVSFPVVIASWIKKIPLYIHESNSVFGFGNYISVFFAKKVFLGLPVRRNPFKEKSLLTGTPVREIFNIELNIDELKSKFNFTEPLPVILIFGGSQGAKNINEAAYYLLVTNRAENKKFYTIHITGKKSYEEFKKKYQETELLNEYIRIFPYYENMNELYAVSDLVISRSGASTIAELIKMKKPAILIPLPFASQNHQYENARILSERHCAYIVKDDKYLKTELRKTLDFIIQKNRLEVMKKSYERIDIPSGTESADIIISNILNDLRGD